MTRALVAFWRDERGATSIEYAVIACCVSLLIVAGARIIGTRVQTLFFQPVASNLT